MPNIIQARAVLLKAPAVIIPPGGLGLQTDCTAFWEFENTSWLDATGNGTTLTGTGSPTTTTGKIGNGASLVASTSYLSAASNSNILNGGSFSVQVWANIAGNTGELLIFNKSLDTFANREWGFGTRFNGSANVFSFGCENTSGSRFRAEDTVAVTAGSYVHLVGTFNSSTGAITLYKNGSQVGTATLTGTMVASASAPLGFGRHASATATVNTSPDQAGFWKGRVLSAGDVTALYNSGNGLSWAAMA